MMSEEFGGEPLKSLFVEGKGENSRPLPKVKGQQHRVVIGNLNCCQARGKCEFLPFAGSVQIQNLKYQEKVLSFMKLSENR